MLKSKFALPFFCAAGALLASFVNGAEDVIAVNTTVTDINEFSLNYSTDFKIDGASTVLTLRQHIDGEYVGTISGNGELKKTGDGNLVFGGKFSAFEGFVSVEAGTLTFNDTAEILEKGIEISNASCVVFNCNGNFGIPTGGQNAAIEIYGHGEDNAKRGIVEKLGAGNLYLSGAEGDELRVYSGKAIFDGNAQFNKILVAGGAELCIGDGRAHGGLSAATTLEDGAVLRFNRKSASDNPLHAKGGISGSGTLVFDGDASVYLGGAMDKFTGEIRVNAGTALLLDSSGEGKSVETQAKHVLISGGSFGGNGSVAGDIEVKGKYFAQGATENVNGGSLNLSVAGGVLKIGGNLSFETARQEIVTDKDGKETLRLCDYGGQTTVYLSEDGCGRADVAGTASLAGTLVISGSEKLKPGQVAVFLHADKPIQGDFQLVYTSANTMLVSPGIAGIGFNEYGVASIENRKLRERAAFKEHDGIAEFVNYIAAEAELNRPNEVAQTVNLAMGEHLSDTINNYSPLAHCSLAGMPVRQSNLEVDYLQRILKPGLSYPPSPDGLTIPANTQYFTTVLSEFTDNDDDIASPIYNADAIGIMSGFYRWVDSERLVGGSLAVHHASASVHGFSGSSFDDTALRARVFAGMMPANTNWNLIFGASAAVHYYDIDHETDTGINRAEEGGLEAGAFFAWTMRDDLGDDWSFSPYARLDLNYIRVDTIREKGSYSALEVDAFGYTSVRTRLGFDIERKLQKIKSDQVLTVGVNVALVAELGKDPRITSEFKAYENSRTTIRGAVEERGALEVTPHLNFEIAPKWILDTAVRFQVAPDGGSSAAFSIGLNSRF